MASISSQLQHVRERIGEAAQRAGRGADEVRLIAVSKSKRASLVREAYEAGQRDFGENYVQEWESKALELQDLTELRWHMIGHLQTNKARQVARLAHLVQSVDSTRLVRELGRRVREAGRTLPILLEINVGDEAQKTGAQESEARELLKEARGEEGLEVRGLMTVPPFELEASETEAYFDRLRKLRDELGGAGELPELSMGMSHDFEVAIGQGATMVRVGTLIFGAR